MSGYGADITGGLGQPEQRLLGIPLSPGAALGRVCQLFTPSHPDDDTVTFDANAETHHLDAALGWLEDRLKTLTAQARQRLGDEASEIFQAHRMILQDPSVRTGIIEAMDTLGQPAARAASAYLRSLEDLLEVSALPTLRERAVDIAELRRALVDHLSSSAATLRCRDTYCAVGACRLGNVHILVADELTPALTLEMDRNTVGFVVTRGGPTSHAAILARALQLPAVGGVSDLMEWVTPDADLLVDGTAGIVIINPSAATAAAYPELRRPGHRPINHTQPVPGLQVLANLDGADRLADVLAANAEGIGLYRTELEVMADRQLFTEDALTERYDRVITALAPRPVHIRLLDVGADKPLPWLDLPEEPNPALGCRGARLLLARPDLLRPQARALVRAVGKRPVGCMWPMVEDAAQFARLRREFERATADLPPSAIRHGIMIEVPSALWDAEALLRNAAFAAIGTNDLIQYLFAADRECPNVNHRAMAGQPLVWRLLSELARTAKRLGVPLSLCGEIAGDPAFTERILDAGIGTVSVTPRAIEQLRGQATAILQQRANGGTGSG